MAGPLADVSVALLAGGLGERLRSAVADRPKVLASVGGRPFVTYLLDQLAAAGARRIVVCTGYMHEHIEEALGATYKGMEVGYSCEQEPLGTGGAFRLACEQLDEGLVLGLNGDSFCGVDYARFCAAHAVSGTGAAVLLVRVPDMARYGRVDVDGQGRVLQFCEKEGRAQPGLINAGAYLFPRSWLRDVPSAQPVSLEREVLPRWVELGLSGFEARGPFLDIGIPSDYKRAEGFFAAEHSAARLS